MIQASIYSRVDRHPKPGTTKAGKPTGTVSIEPLVSGDVSFH